MFLIFNHKLTNRAGHAFAAPLSNYYRYFLSVGKGFNFQTSIFIKHYPFNASEPLTISIISLVIAAWRALL